MKNSIMLRVFVNGQTAFMYPFSEVIVYLDKTGEVEYAFTINKDDIISLVVLGQVLTDQGHLIIVP